jgi:hypothetical protein
MPDTLPKVLINLASGSLLTVLVLYLVLHWGLVFGHSRLCSSRRWENKGQDTRYWGNYGRRGCANFYMERLCISITSQSRVHAWSTIVSTIFCTCLVHIDICLSGLEAQCPFSILDLGEIHGSRIPDATRMFLPLVVAQLC